MKIQSMTGFGKGEAQNEDYTILVELKSVNNRFKDMRFKLPSLLSSLEIGLRGKLSERFKRGSFDVFAQYRKIEGKNSFDELDEKKIAAYIEKIKKVVAGSGINLDVRPCDFLRGEFYVEQDGSREENMKKLVSEAFEKALEQLEESRLSEGKKLSVIIQDHKKNFEQHYKRVVDLVNGHQKGVQEKLKKAFQEHGSDLKIDEPRFMQEVVYYLEKIDIHEEIDRIRSHLTKFDKMFATKNEIGKELDFLLQELNRETNTIGSKTVLDEISDAVVQMKVHLEKIREQALNLE